MSQDPRFLDVEDAVAVQARHIAESGGAGTTYLPAALEAAIHSVCNRHYYAHSDIFDLAAYYVFYIAKGHPFIDGNKRTALSLALMFLEFNGVTRTYWQDPLVLLVLGICEDVLSPALLRLYFRRRSYLLCAMIVLRTALLLSRKRVQRQWMAKRVAHPSPSRADRRTVVKIAILALVSFLALIASFFTPELRSWLSHLWESLPFAR